MDDFVSNEYIFMVVESYFLNLLFLVINYFHDSIRPFCKFILQDIFCYIDYTNKIYIRNIQSLWLDPIV